jgi:hypothetical protein
MFSRWGALRQNPRSIRCSDDPYPTFSPQMLHPVPDSTSVSCDVVEWNSE